jgi:hypothetical protein
MVMLKTQSRFDAFFLNAVQDNHVTTPPPHGGQKAIKFGFWAGDSAFDVMSRVLLRQVRLI